MSVKITELPFLNTLDDNDVLAGVDTSADTTSKVTVGTLKEYIDSNTTYTAGTNIDITNNVVSAPNVYTKSEVNGLLPTKVSDLTNDSGFITKAVNDLTNYYTSSNTYTKTEVNNLISQVNQFNVEIVQTLPSSNIDPHTIYFVAKTGSTGDVYDEYIYINNAWELIGSTDIDLTGYVKNTDYASSSTGGVFKTSNSFATDVSNGYLNAQGKTYTQYGSLNNNAFISKQTLENVITGKELTNADDLEELADGLSEDINYVGREVDSLSTVYNALPYASDDGTSITLNDTVETKFKKFDLKGNTSQTGTPTTSSPIDVNVVSGDNSIVVCGKNLFNINGDLNTRYDGVSASTTQNTVSGEDLTTISNSNNVIPYGQRIYVGTGNTIYISVKLKNVTYSTEPSSTSTVGGVYVYKENNSVSQLVINYTYGEVGATKTGTITATTDYVYLCFARKSGVTNATFTSIMFSYDTTTYEPYIGNTYPINLPTKNYFNDVIELGSINPSDGTLSDNASRTRSKNFIEVKPNTTYYITRQNTSGYMWVIGYTSGEVGITDGNYNGYASALMSLSTTSSSFTTSATTKYIKWYQTIDINLSEKIMLGLGTKVNTYTPYGTTPIELCKIGNYQDYIYKDSGKWYLYKEIGKVVLNGSETWRLQNASVGQFIISNSTITNNIGFSDNFIIKTSYSSNDKPYLRPANGNLYAEIGTDFLSEVSVDAWTTWLSNNNTNLYYVLATPTNTLITYQPLIDQLNELYIAKSKLGQTNISQVNNDLPFILDVEGAKLAGSGGGGGTTDYTDLTNKPSINSVTLSGNKSLSDLGIQPAGNYITNTNYATSSTGGVVKTYPNVIASDINSNGVIYASTKTYSQYSSLDNGAFIGKGTLENVITGKQLVDYSTLSNSFEYYDEGIREFISAQIDSLASITNAFPTDKKEGNYMVLDETAKVRFKDVILKGNMSQASSPTPSNPVDVKTVSGTYNISFIGKNKLQNNIQDETYKGITITNNGDGSFSLNGTPTGSFGRNIATNLFLPAGTYTISANTIPSGFYVALDGRSDTTLNSTTFSKTFTLNTDTTISEVGIWITKEYTYNDTIFVQIERSDKQTDYEPYDKYTYYNFNLRDYSLCKIGNYQDEIYFDSGSWYASYATSSMYFDSSSGFVADWSSGNYYCYKKAGSTSYIVPNTFVSKYFADLTTADFTAKNKYGVYMDNTGIYIVTDISTLSSFNTWLDTNQPTVYFARKSRNTHEISDTTLLMNLNYLASSQACKGSTTIYAEGTNAPLIMEIEAVQDLSSVLDRLELLENSNNS